MTDTLNYILNRLDHVKPAGADQWMACCPAHEDFNPSLSVADTGGSVLMHCHAGCSIGDICDSLGLKVRDLFSKDARGNLSDAEYANAIAEKLRRREVEKAKKYDEVARRARDLWRVSHPASTDHPYLIDKAVPALGLRQRAYHLLVPIVYRGLLVNLQRIAGNGSKVFLKEGRITGCYSPIGKIDESKPLYLCEGWATGASVFAMHDCAVACAMVSGNLLAAGTEIKALYPDVRLIIAGDDDRAKAKNPGRTAALAAANELHCEITFPDWSDDAPAHYSDFNDYAKWSFENVGHNSLC